MDDVFGRQKGWCGLLSPLNRCGTKNDVPPKNRAPPHEALAAAPIKKQKTNKPTISKGDLAAAWRSKQLTEKVDTFPFKGEDIDCTELRGQQYGGPDEAEKDSLTETVDVPGNNQGTEKLPNNQTENHSKLPAKR